MTVFFISLFLPKYSKNLKFLDCRKSCGHICPTINNKSIFTNLIYKDLVLRGNSAKEVTEVWSHSVCLTCMFSVQFLLNAQPQIEFNSNKLTCILLVVI